MAPKHFLNNITIPSPCNADWNSMIGNDQVRFCQHCNLDVHNLSQMTRAQAQRLVARSGKRLCVRYHQDAAGRPATLPVGRKLHHIARRASRIAAGAFTATLSITSAVAQGSISYQRDSSNPSVATQPNTRATLNSSIVGAVTDQNGALITGATVFVSNDEMKLALYTDTGSSGEFKIDSLQAGLYQIRIEAPGFAGDESRSIYVSANSQTRADRTLKVAEIEASVEIEGSAVVEVSSGGSVAYVAPADPFVRAAQEDNLEELTALIAGANVNLRDEQSGTTALEHAVKNANQEMVKLLLQSGANVNAKNENGTTVLMMLDDDATSDLVWDLINAGADVNLKDNSGNTALMQTATENNSEVLKALLDAGADVNAKNETGRTALMQAASEGLVNNVRLLILAGADINALDEDDDSALALAAEDNHAAVVRLLKSKGALEAAAKVKEEK